MAKRITIPSREEHARLWSALSASDRRLVLRTVGRGEAMPNRKQARVAVGIARQQQRFWSWIWLLGPAVSLLSLRNGAAAVAVNAVFGAIFMGALSLFRIRRARASEAANVALVEGRRKA